MHTTHAGFGPQNNNTGSGTQYNYNGTGQNINHWQHFGVEIDSRRVLWDAIKHVDFSHKAEHQFARGECLEGTREEVLRIIHGWRIPDGWEPPICWLSGAAGVGKTSIAMTIAKSCEQDGLVESFFFFRSDPNRNHPSVLILAIAHGLAVAHPLVREEINDRIRANWSILGARMEEQFQELVIRPITKICARAKDDPFVFEDPTLVIIDGLDECGDEETQSRILSIISSTYQQHPHFPLRFLICSRPEAWISEAFNDRPLLETTKVVLLDHTFKPGKDIERYYRHEFQDIRRSSKYRNVQFPDPWPSERVLTRLVRTSDGQFAHASTSVRFLRLPFSNPLRQLCLLLDNDPDSRPSKSPFHALNSLYHMILSAHPDRSQILPILAAIIILPSRRSRRPSPDFLELLLRLYPGDVSLALRGLHSVLDTRSGDFFVDESAQHDFLAKQWLQALSSSRVKGYDFSRIAETDIHGLFSRWEYFCYSLPERPTPQLLESLQSLDFSALFFCSLDSLLMKPEEVTVTLVGHLGESCVFRVDGFRRQDGYYKWVEKWPESGDNLDYVDVIKRFANHPKCFLFHVSGNCDDIGTADIHRAVRSISRSQLKYRAMIGECEASVQYDWKRGKPPVLIHIKECYCYCSGRWEPAPDHPLRHLCQQTSLHTVENLVSSFLSIDLGTETVEVVEFSGESLGKFEDNFTQLDKRGLARRELEIGRIIQEMLDSSLLQHCAFETELFFLCGSFFSCIERCSSSELGMTSDKSESRRKKLTEWLKTSPGAYVHEADDLGFRINLFFMRFNKTPALLRELDCFYDDMLNSHGNHDIFLATLGAIAVLRYGMSVPPSPAVIKMLLGLSWVQVAQILHPTCKYLSFEICSQADKIFLKDGTLLNWNTFTDYLFNQTRSKRFHVSKSAMHHSLAVRWLQAISRSRIGGYSLDQLYKSSTRFLFTGWIWFCTALPTPTQEVLDGLQNLDLSALFLCLQADASERSNECWDKTFGRITAWLEESTAPVDSDLIKRFKNQPKCFHLDVSFDRFWHGADILHWVVLVTIQGRTESELTYRAERAFLKYTPARRSSNPLPIRITDCHCHSKSSTQCPGHSAYQAACLDTAKALVSDYRINDPTISDDELHGIFINMLDSSLLEHCAFKPELFQLCRTFFSAVELHHPPWWRSGLFPYQWTVRRAHLLEWLETCPHDYAREAEALKAQVMSLFPDGIEIWRS